MVSRQIEEVESVAGVPWEQLHTETGKTGADIVSLEIELALASLDRNPLTESALGSSMEPSSCMARSAAADSRRQPLP